MTRPTTTSESLSTSGERRRDDILRLAQSALGDRVRRRRSRRALGAAFVLVAAVIGLAPLTTHTPSRPRTEPSLGNGSLAASISYPFALMNDEDLADELAKLGHPISVVRIGDTDVRLVDDTGATVSPRTLVRN